MFVTGHKFVCRPKFLNHYWDLIADVLDLKVCHSLDSGSKVTGKCMLSPAFTESGGYKFRSMCQPVCLSVTLSFPQEISKSLWAFAVKFYITIPHSLKKTPTEFEVKGQHRNFFNTFVSERYLINLWAFAMKFNITTPYGLRKTSVDFEVKSQGHKFIHSVCA